MTLSLDPATTALIVIDLQRGIVAREAAPHSPNEVVERCAKLAEAFRSQKALVVLVHVAFSDDDRDRLKPEADSVPPAAPRPPDWSDIVPQIGPRPGDIVITKRQWGGVLRHAARSAATPPQHPHARLRRHRYELRRRVDGARCVRARL